MSRAMKDSGIPWIGEIPEAWGVSKIGYLYRSQLGKMLQPARKSNDDTFEPFLCAANIKMGRVESLPFKEMWFSLNDKKSYSVTKGDLLIVEGGDVGSCAIYEQDKVTMIQNSVHRIRANSENCIRYLFYWCNFIKYSGYLDLVCNKATIAHYTKEKLSNTPLLIPAQSEQQAIADYLDRKTQQIDATVEREKQHIEKLKQYRQSLINETGTKGLDPTAPLRDSGIPWIGEIPKSWGLCKMSYLYRTQLGKMLQPVCQSEEETFESFLCAANIKPTGIELTPRKEMWFSPRDKEVYSVVKGDLLIVEGGDVGSCAIYHRNETTFIQNSVHRIRGNKQQNINFLLYWCTFIKTSGYLDLVCNKATIAHYTKEKLGNTPLLVPSLPEQKAIADYLDRKTAQIDAVLTQKETLICKLLEYKKSLIYEAVTGKLLVEHNDE